MTPTAPHVANELICEALHPYPDNLVIATKIGVVRDEYKTFNAVASAETLREQVEENLTTLGQARLDLVYLRVGGDGMLFPPKPPSRSPSPRSPTSRSVAWSVTWG